VTGLGKVARLANKAFVFNERGLTEGWQSTCSRRRELMEQLFKPALCCDKRMEE
jgi:hypothetical protein